MSPPPKSARRNIKFLSVISVTNLDTFRKIARNVRCGSKRKVSLVLLFVSNLIWQKFLIILGGWILAVQLIFLKRCRDSLRSKPQTQMRGLSLWEIESKLQ